MTDWRNLLITTTNKAGQIAIRPLLANVITVLRHHPAWEDVLVYNDFTQQIHKRKQPPCADYIAPPSPTDEWTDGDILRLVDWLSREESLHVTPEIAHGAAVTVAKVHSYHPVRSYLSSLKWDGCKRLPTWLSDYLGAAPNPYATMVGIKWMISAVARVIQPGCKADHMIVLEGSQGLGKSTALRVLGGEWYTDELADMGSKDSAMQLRGAWIIELSELDAVNRSDTSRVKAFVSRTTDRFREPYGKLVAAYPRQCVFAGSSNHDQYLRDETGNRRFWPVACDGIHIASLKRFRDQLWAEAVHRYKSGETWWPESAESVIAREEQESRYQHDEWEVSISRYLANKEDVSVGEILANLFMIDKSQWTQRDQRRVAGCLAALGWLRHQTRVSGRREWRYFPNVTSMPAVTTSNHTGDTTGDSKNDNDFTLFN